MSLTTFGLAHMTLLTMGLGVSFVLTGPRVIPDITPPKEVTFENIPVEVDFKEKEVQT